MRGLLDDWRHGLRQTRFGGDSPAGVAFAVFAILAGLHCAASYGPVREARRTPPAPLLREE